MVPTSLHSNATKGRRVRRAFPSMIIGNFTLVVTALETLQRRIEQALPGIKIFP
jgi:hypothetical protein